MAKIALGATVTGIRGTAGGLTFSANRGGAFVRLWSQPPTRRTIRQSGVRGLLGSASSGWRLLSPAEQAGWVAWANHAAQVRYDSLGNAYYMSGAQAYVSVQRCLDVVGRARSVSVPLSSKPTAPTCSALVVGVGSGACSMTLTAGEWTPSYDIVVETIGYASVGVLSAYGRWTTLYAAQTPASGSLSLTAAFDSVVGPRPAGSRWFVRTSRQSPLGYRGTPQVLVADAA